MTFPLLRSFAAALDVIAAIVEASNVRTLSADDWHRIGCALDQAAATVRELEAAARNSPTDEVSA